MTQVNSNDPEPSPIPGGTDVEPLYQALTRQFETEEYERGIKKYGVTLQYPNGRDIFADFMREHVAEGRYVVQLLMHVQALEKLLGEAYKHIRTAFESPESNMENIEYMTWMQRYQQMILQPSLTSAPPLSNGPPDPSPTNSANWPIDSELLE